MAVKPKETIKIHRTNLYEPIAEGVSHLAINPCSDLLAVTKHHTTPDCQIDQNLTIIEILELHRDGNPSSLEQLVEYSHIRGLTWTSNRHLLTVDYEKTINVYDVSSGEKIFSLITDYGPIICLSYCAELKLLLTGTSLGSVVVYEVADDGKSVVFFRHMTRTFDQVQNLDLSFRKNDSSHEKDRTCLAKKNGISKKRVSESSDESEEDEINITVTNTLGEYTITIYGTVQGRITAWDFHRGTILDSFSAVGDELSQCSSLLILDDGSIVTGDTSGVLSIYDDKSFTCRQSLKISEGAIVCLTKNQQETSLIATGIDPTIMLLKRDKLDKSNYILFEKSVVHQCPVSCARFSRKKEFFTAGLDGYIVCHKIRKGDGGRKTHQRSITLPNFGNNIYFSQNEMLFQRRRALILWRQPIDGENVGDNNKINSTKKLLQVKAGTFVHCSTFSDKWICLSTHKSFHIYERTGGKLVEFVCDRDPKVTGRHTMLICCDNECLVAGIGRKLYIIQLPVQKVKSRTRTCKVAAQENPSCEVITEYNLEGTIQQLQYLPNVNQLVVVSGIPRRHLQTFTLKTGQLNDIKPKCLGTIIKPILFVANNLTDPKDKNLYIYGSKKQIATLELNKKWNSETLAQLTYIDAFSDRSKDMVALGLTVLARNRCILYDNYRLYEVNLEENKTQDLDTNFPYIITVGTMIENKTLKYLTIVQVPPDDYLASLPKINQPVKKFGT